MRKTLRKLTALLVSLAMLSGMLPVVSFAAEEEVLAQSVDTTAIAETFEGSSFVPSNIISEDAEVIYHRGKRVMKINGASGGEAIVEMSGFDYPLVSAVVAFSNPYGKYSFSCGEVSIVLDNATLMCTSSKLVENIEKDVFYKLAICFEPDGKATVSVNDANAVTVNGVYGDEIVFNAERGYMYVDRFSAQKSMIRYSNGRLESSLYMTNSGSVVSVAGVGGKNSNDYSAKLTSAASSTNSVNVYYRTGAFEISANSIYKLEANIYPESNVAGLFVGTQGHVAMSSNCSSFVPGKWNKLCYYVNTSTREWFLYMNGVLSSNGTLSTTAVNYIVGKSNEFRIVVNKSSTDTSQTAVVCFDDVKLSTADSVLAPSSAFELVSDGSFDVTDGVINGAPVYAQLATVAGSRVDTYVFDSQFAPLDITANSSLPGDSRVVFADGDGNYSYYSIPAETELVNISSDFKKSTFANYGSYDLVNGFGGKSADDTSLHLYGVCSDNNTYYGTSTFTYDTESTYVLEASFYPVSGVKRIYIGTSQHTAVSGDILANEYNLNEWNRLQYVYMPKEGISALYLNGDFKGYYTLNQTAKDKMDAGAVLRFIAYQASADGLDLYVDDIRVYMSKGMPVSAVNDILSTEIAYADISEKTIYVSTGADASDVSSSLADKNSCKVNVITSDASLRSGAVCEGDRVVFENSYGLFEYYDAKVLSDGDVVYDDDTIIANGGSGSMLMSARYNDRGVLYDLDIAKENKNGIVSIVCAPGDEASLKIMLWNSAKSLKPLAKNTSYNEDVVSTKPSILFVGSEHVEDIAAYFGSVASAVGLDLGVGVVSKEDANYSDQLTNVANDGYYRFTYNGEYISDISLDSVASIEEYRWDYVVLDGDYDYSASQSETYRTEVVSFASYVCGKFSNSSIAVTQPLANQTGYLSNNGTAVFTAAAHSELNNAIRTATEKAVATVNANNNRSVVFAPTGTLFNHVASKVNFNTTYNKTAHEALTDGAYVGSGLTGANDKGSISLYRDGTHASPAGRYVLACALLKSFMGYSCNGEGFTDDVSLTLDCDVYGSSETISCQFGYSGNDCASKLAYYVNAYYGTDETGGETESKSDGYREKTDSETAVLESFDEYTGAALGNGWHLNSGSSYMSAVEDKSCGGKYLRINKTAENGKVEAKRYFDPVSGSMRVDMQLCLFDIASNMSLYLYSHNYSDDANDVTTLTVKDGKLYVSGNGDSAITTLEADIWYNISLYLYADTYTMNVVLDGAVVKENIPYSMDVRSLSAARIVSDSDTIANIGIDNFRVSYITADEYNSTYAVSNTSADVLMDEKFESDGAYGNLASGTSIVSGNTAGNITYQNDGSNGYLRASRTTSESGSCSVVIPYKPTTNDVIFECKVKINDTKSSYKLMSVYCNGYCYTYYFNYDGSLLGSKLTLCSYENNGSSSSGVARAKRLSTGRWYNVKVETHTNTGTYDLTFNGTKYSNLKYDTKSGTNNSFRFAITAGDASSYDLDDVKVTEVPLTFDGYNPDATGAPEMYDWQNTYMSAPEGIVVNAEDMDLDNFTITDNSLFHGGKGATVSNWGVGSAKFRFVGNSGYYAINVGYKEAEGMFDSSYELLQNGKRVDWWIGQYDDGQRHVRKSRTYHYIENGDEFEVIGTYGKDPASLDYVEFNISDIPEFTFGDLIDDASSAHPSYWLDSSWVGEEEGGYVRNSHTIYDCRTDAKSAAIRNFYPTAKSMSLDYTMNVNTSTPFELTMGDGFKDAFKISFNGGNVSCADSYVSGVYGNGSRLCRLVVNRDTNTVSLYINGVAAVNNVPMADGIDKLSVLKFSTTDRGKGTVVLSNLRMNAGLILDESFRAMVNGSDAAFAGWTVNNASVASMNSENCDTKSFKINAGGTASKAIETNEKIVTFETNFIIPTKKDGVKINIGSDSSKIGFYTSGNNIYYDDGDGSTANDKAVWTNYLHNIWYSASIVANIETKTATFAINDFSKQENVKINLDSFTNVSYEAGSAEGELWIDDVKVIPGTYACDVPEPQPAKSDYRIVMEACDLWREGHHFGNDSIVPYDNRTPFLGYLEDGNPEVADWETKFLVEHGINTYATCWYVNANWNNSPIKTPRNGAKLNVGYMKSKYADMLDFAILVTVIGSNNGADNFLEHHVRYWIERYFRSPNYWKVDNKPVIPIYDVSAMNKLGSDILNRIEAMLIEHGFAGAIFMGTNNGVTSTANGYDYKYQYHQSNDDIVGHNVIRALKSKQSSDGVKFIASPSQGWGNEAWGRADRKINMPLDEWQASLEWIKNVYMPQEKSADSSSLSANTLWLGNWNEYAEGHFLAPSNIAGFGYVEAVRKVFVSDSTAHTDVLPEKHFDQLTSYMYR